MLRYLLITDGSSDKCLLHIIDWLLRELVPACEIMGEWANPAEYTPSSQVLGEKIPAALRFYDCDLIFVHRDAEREPPENRINEVLASVRQSNVDKPVSVLVPVRMMEAWLLTDERAIRRAADNPNGRDTLSMPTVGTIEGLPDPKDRLCRLLTTACGLPQQRRRRFEPRLRVHRVAELTPSFERLRQLDAFRRFETSTRSALHNLGLLGTNLW